MKEETKKRITELILEELAEKIKLSDHLKRKLEPFADLPVEKVADAILKQFEYLLSSELRDLIIHLIEQEIAAEEAATLNAELAAKPAEEVIDEKLEPHVEVKLEPKIIPEPAQPAHIESVMEIYGSKERFPSEQFDIELKADDWFYIYGFCYAPDSSGKGIPSKKLAIKGIDKVNNIFLLDYGDVRFFLNKLNTSDYTLDKTNKLSLHSSKAKEFKYEHEKILNILRSEEILVPLPFWTIIQNHENIIKKIEDNYVELLRSLIDVHDAIDWDVEVFAYDKHIIELPVIASASRERPPARETRHKATGGRDIKVLEKLLFKEKSLAQEIHSQLLLHSAKARVDFMIRLDNAFMDDWKSILSVRYTVNKDKRKNFYKTVKTLQQEYQEYELMIRVTSPNVRFSF